MCTLSKELFDYFEANPNKLISQNKLPVEKAFDSFHIINLINRSASIFSESSCEFSRPSNYIVYYGKNPIIISDKITTDTVLTSSQEYYCPIGMVFNIDQLFDDGHIREIYPFDPLKFEVSHDKNSADVFKIDTSFSGIEQYIVYFFGNNFNYKAGEDILVNSPGSILSDRIFRMHHHDSVQETALTISIKLDESFDFLKYAKCIVVPDKLMATTTFQKLAKEENRCIKTYPIRRGRLPSIYNEIVEQLCEDFLNGCGHCYLKESKQQNSSIYCSRLENGGCNYHGINL